MNARLLLTAGALSLGLGLTSTAIAQQGAQPDPMMQQGGMQGQPPGQMGMDPSQEQRPMRRSGKKMKKPMKQKKMMRPARQQDGMQQPGGMGAAPDEGM